MLGRRGTAAVRDVALAGRAGACAAWARGVGVRRVCVCGSVRACGVRACVSMRANMRAGLRVCMRRAGVHGCARGAHVCVLVGVSGLQAEGYGDGFGGFDGVAVERGGLVTPLANGVSGGGD